jgi:hypothetical protein
MGRAVVKGIDGMAPLDQIDQIQDLVAEIDGVLRNDDRPWILGGRVRQRQRQTLEHLRSALTRLGGDLRQQATTSIVNSSATSLSATNLSATNLSATNLSEPALPGQPPRLKASAISYGAAQTAIDTFTQDLQTLRTTLLQSLQTEVTSLQEQRDQLRREIQEMQRQAPGQTMLSEGMMQAFLQQLMLQLQERLSQQVLSQQTQQLASQPIGQAIIGQSTLGGSSLAPIDQAQLQFAQIQHLHDQSETLVRQVDSTLTVFAHTLEQNMRTYQQALEKGLEKMHSMGQQGEVLFAEFVNRLADRLEAQASAYFLASEGLASEGQASQSANGAIGGSMSSPGEPIAIGPGTSPKAFNVELGNVDLGPGLAPVVVQPDAAPIASSSPINFGSVAMDLTDGTPTPVLPQAVDQSTDLTEVNWQSVAPSQPEAALDVAARVRPANPVVAPEPTPPAPEPTPPIAPVTRSAPTNELDAFYADLMILTGGMSVADGLMTTPTAPAPVASIDRNVPRPDAPFPTDSPEIAPAKRGSVDQEPVAQPPAPIAPTADRANVVQSLTELFGDRKPEPSPGYTSETDSDVDDELDSGLFAQYSVTGPADAQKKNLM